MDRLSLVLPGVLRKRGLFQHAVAASITMKAQEWLTQEVSKEGIQVLSFKDQTLWISCEHSIVLQEVQMASEGLKTHLRKEFETLKAFEIRLQRAKD